ncbi:MAG: heme-binding domain-containing protein [Candidatus Binatia bacterium]
MKRWVVKVGLAGVVLVVAAQVVPVARTNPAVTRDVAAPVLVAALLRQACYDCHSRETVWPWYSRVAPVSWLVAHDVNEGRETVDFSAWDQYGPRRQAKLLAEVMESIEEGEMPPWYYVLMHPSAHLGEPARATLVAWAREMRERSVPSAPGSTAGTP